MLEQHYSRREFVKSTGLVALGLTASKIAETNLLAEERSQESPVYLGTYTSGKSVGIYPARFNNATGALTILTPSQSTNPSFLTIDRSKHFLYAVNEVMDFAGQKSGAVSAFSIDPQTHELRLLNQQASRGGAPCYVTVDRTNRFVLVANYMGGNASVFPLKKNGALGEATSFVQHQGTSVNKDRQEGPHAHSIVLDPSNKFAYVSDLGIDKIMIYRFDEKIGKLTPAAQPYAQLKAGSGPRHFTFHPRAPFAYVINEMGGSITAFAFNQRTGMLTEKQTVPTLPSDFSGSNTTADIHFHPSGKFLYGSNRGHNSIVAYAVNGNTGELALIGHQSTEGETPRNFAIDPMGKFLLVANQDSDSIITLRIDESTGKLSPTGLKAEVPKPVCIKFY